MTKVSVIIPVYNEEKDIKECLVSLSEQSIKDFEVIVVDDGSTDKTWDMVSGFKNLKFKIKNLRAKHAGAGAARNLGAEKASGDILVFLDADMTFEKHFLEKLIEPIIKKDAIGTFSKEEFLANKDNIWARCWNLNRNLPEDRMHKQEYPIRQKVFRAILRAKFIQAGGFDPRGGYIDDWSLSERLREEALAAPGAVFYHKNPSTLKEVFVQSRWMAKRKYKFGYFGIVYSLIKFSLPISLIIGVFKSFSLHLLPFTLFKVVSDLGQFIGIIEFITGRVEK